MIASEQRAFQIAAEIKELRPELAPQLARIAKPNAGWDVVQGLSEILEMIRENT